MFIWFWEIHNCDDKFPCLQPFSKTQDLQVAIPTKKSWPSTHHLLLATTCFTDLKNRSIVQLPCSGHWYWVVSNLPYIKGKKNTITILLNKKTFLISGCSKWRRIQDSGWLGGSVDFHHFHLHCPTCPQLPAVWPVWLCSLLPIQTLWKVAKNQGKVKKNWS